MPTTTRSRRYSNPLQQVQRVYHPEQPATGGLVVRVHPTRGLQFWGPFSAWWAEIDGTITAHDTVLRYEDTWAEPESPDHPTRQEFFLRA